MNITRLAPELVDLWESFARARTEPVPPTGSLVTPWTQALCSFPALLSVR